MTHADAGLDGAAQAVGVADRLLQPTQAVVGRLERHLEELAVTSDAAL